MNQCLACKKVIKGIDIHFYGKDSCLKEHHEMEQFIRVIFLP